MLERQRSADPRLALAEAELDHLEKGLTTAAVRAVIGLALVGAVAITVGMLGLRSLGDPDLLEALTTAADSRTEVAQNTPPAIAADPKTAPAEKILPPSSQPGDAQANPGVDKDRGTTGAGTGTGDSLSETLRKSEGVIHPDPDKDPEIRKPAPVPDPGTMPVIPPPGTRGNQPEIRPK